MPPKGWTTPDQATWLQARIPEFLKAQTDKVLSRFFSLMFEEWFTKYSERDRLFGNSVEPMTPAQLEELGEAVRIQQGRLKTWFHWHSTAHTTRSARQRTDNGPYYRQHPDADGRKAKRVQQEPEVYCSLYYKMKLKALLDERLEGQSVSAGERLSLLRQLSREQYENESIEVKREVKAAQDKVRIQYLQQKEEAAKRDPNAERTAAQYQVAFSNIEADLTAQTARNVQNTGLAFVTLWGGPNGQRGGDIEVGVVSAGRNELGHTFNEALATFEPNVLEPFAAFVKKVFPRELRQRRVVPQDTSSAGDQDSRLLSVTPALSRASSPKSSRSPTPDGDSGLGLLSQQAQPSFSSRATTPGLDTEASQASSNASVPKDATPKTPEPIPPSSPTITPPPTLAAAKTSTLSPAIVSRRTSARKAAAQPPSPSLSSTPLSTSYMLSLIKIDKAAPGSVKEAANHLTEQHLGEDWLVGVNNWLDLEKTLGYGIGTSKTRKLPTANRPWQLAWWQKRGRSYTSPPVVENVHEFEREFTKWFSNMSKDEDVMRIGGPNGFLVVMLLLCWWGRAVLAENGVVAPGWAAWRDTLAVVIDMLNTLLGRVARKRVAPSPKDTPTPKRFRKRV